MNASYTEIGGHDLRVNEPVRCKSHGRAGTIDVHGRVESIRWNADQTRGEAEVRLECSARLTELGWETVSGRKTFTLRRSGRWCLKAAEDLPIRALHHPLLRR